MVSENKEQIEPDSKRARMSPEFEACFKEDKKNLDRALKRLDAGEDLIKEDIDKIVFYALAEGYIHLLDKLQRGAKVDVLAIMENEGESIHNFFAKCDIEMLMYWTIDNGCVDIFKTLIKHAQKGFWEIAPSQ